MVAKAAVATRQEAVLAALIRGRFLIVIKIMSTPEDGDHRLSISSRADVGPLNEALKSPSPLGSILDRYNQGSSRNLSPNPNQKNFYNADVSEYSVFGEGSIADSMVSTLVGGVHNSMAHWKVLAFGQVISFFLAASGAASDELNNTCKAHVPLTQTSIVGVVLMFLGAVRLRGWCAGCCLARGRKKTDGDDANENGDENIDDDLSLVSADVSASPTYKSRILSSEPRSFCWGLQTIRAPSWAYFISGLVAVEARYFIFLSFKYTSFSFIYLVEALAIPSAMAFSRLLLRRRYRPSHVLGGFICICGISLSAIYDIRGSKIQHIGTESEISSAQHLAGDILALSGSVLLGLDDVISEELIKNHGGVDEVLFVKWFFGLGIALTQLAIMERDALRNLFAEQGGDECDLSTRFIILGAYAFFQVVDMVGELRFLQISEAALLNLSLLSSNLWATLFLLFTDGVFPSASYYASLILIVTGIVCYEAGPSPIGHATPSDIKIARHQDTDITEVAGNPARGLEMT